MITRKSMSTLLVTIFAFSMLVTFFSFITVKSSDETSKIYMDETTVTQGEYGAVTLYISNVKNYAVLDIRIFYDSSAINIYSSNFGYAHNDMPIHEKIDNLIPGTIHYTLISSENTSASGSLLSLYFNVYQDTPAGDYSFTIAIDGVFDENYQPISVSKTNGKVTVEPKTSAIPTIYYSQMVSSQNIEYGDIITYYVYGYDLKKLAASDYEVYYDAEVLSLKSVNIGYELNQNYVIYSENHSKPGLFQLSFISNIGLNYAYPLFELTFESIKNQSETSQIIFIPRNGFDEDLLRMQSPQTVTNIDVKKIDDKPTLKVDSYEGSNNKSFDVYVTLGEMSHVAAGDFIISYSGNIITLTDTVVLYEGAYFVYDHKADQNQVSFSMIELDGITEETVLLKLTFTPNPSYIQSESDILISGSSVVNTSFEDVLLNYQHGKINIGKYYSVKFIDYDGSLIEEVLVKEGQTPTGVFVDERLNTTFKSWDKPLSPIYKDETFQAIYELDMSALSFLNETFTYDNTLKETFVKNLPVGATVTYQSDELKHAGTYPVTASISLDGIYQGEVSNVVTILPKTLNVTIDQHQMGEIDDLPVWTYTTEGLIEGDVIDIEIYSETGYSVGTHTLNAKTTSHDYILEVTKGSLSVDPYLWIYGDVNYDNQVSIFDVALVQLHIADLYPLSTIQTEIADLNFSNSISIHDAVIMKLYLAELYPDWPIKNHDVD